MPTLVSASCGQFSPQVQIRPFRPNCRKEEVLDSAASFVDFGDAPPRFNAAIIPLSLSLCPP